MATVEKYRSPYCPSCGSAPTITQEAAACCDNDECDLLAWDRDDDPEVYKGYELLMAGLYDVIE